MKAIICRRSKETADYDEIETVEAESINVAKDTKFRGAMACSVRILVTYSPNITIGCYGISIFLRANEKYRILRTTEEIKAQKIAASTGGAA